MNLESTATATLLLKELSEDHAEGDQGFSVSGEGLKVRMLTQRFRGVYAGQMIPSSNEVTFNSSYCSE